MYRWLADSAALTELRRMRANLGSAEGVVWEWVDLYTLLTVDQSTIGGILNSAMLFE